MMPSVLLLFPLKGGNAELSVQAIEHLILSVLAAIPGILIAVATLIRILRTQEDLQHIKTGVSKDMAEMTAALSEVKETMRPPQQRENPPPPPAGDAGQVPPPKIGLYQEPHKGDAVVPFRHSE